MKQRRPKQFLVFAAALAIVALVIVLVERRARPTAVLPADERAGTEGLSRAMTFSPPAEQKP
jgi:hypothetical protein